MLAGCAQLFPSGSYPSQMAFGPCFPYACMYVVACTGSACPSTIAYFILPPMGQIGVGGCAAVWSWGVSALGRAYTRLSLSGRSDTKAGVRRDG